MFYLVIATEPFYKFSIPIKSEEYEPETENGLSCDLIFIYTAKYPDEAPVIEIDNSENFKEDYSAELLNHLNEQVLCVHLFTHFVRETISKSCTA